jgi:pyruvate/2-oxoglutarate/acetoin dehydrogenase E1 component
LYWPAAEDSLFTKVIKTQRQLIVNDVSKEIDLANEIREALGTKKLFNFIVVPVSAPT